MEEVVLNLKDPSWWFTGVFFILLGILIAWLIKHTPNALRSLNRKSRARTLKKIKNTRRQSWEMHYQIVIDRSYFLVFCLICLFYSVVLFVSPFAKIFLVNKTIGFMMSSPIYIAEIVWLNKNIFVKKLIKHADKIT